MCSPSGLSANVAEPNAALGGGRGERAVAHFLRAVLRVYRLYVSPAIGCHCRFHPTCSSYAMLAIQRHGPWRGSLLALKRVLRCHPLHPGGVDPVPHADSS